MVSSFIYPPRRCIAAGKFSNINYVFSSQLHQLCHCQKKVWTRTAQLPQLNKLSKSTSPRGLHCCCATGSDSFLTSGCEGSCHNSVLATPPVSAVHFPRVRFPPMKLWFERISSSFMSPTIPDVASMAWNPLKMHSDT